MNIVELHKKLIEAARSQPPDDHVPYAFEQRIMTLVQSERSPGDHWAIWSATLWRAVIPCLALTVLLSGWMLVGNVLGTGSDSLDQDLEETVCAVMENPGETW